MSRQAATVAWLAMIAWLTVPTGVGPVLAEEEDDGPAAAKAVAAKLEAADDQFAAMGQQFQQQLRPVVSGQLHLVRMVCRPTNEQFAKVRADAETTLKATTKKLVESQKKMQMGGFQAGRDQQPDPYREIMSGIADSVNKQLDAERAAKFKVQVEKRIAHRKRVALLNLVAKIDRDLFLTKVQREQLFDVLAEQWDDQWRQNMQIYMQDEYHHYPTLPEKKILPLLTPQQTQIWTTIPKSTVHYWGWGGMFGAMGAIELDGAEGVVDVVIGEAAVAVPDAPDEPEAQKKP